MVPDISAGWTSQLNGNEPAVLNVKLKLPLFAGVTESEGMPAEGAATLWGTESAHDHVTRVPTGMVNEDGDHERPDALMARAAGAGGCVGVAVGAGGWVGGAWVAGWVATGGCVAGAVVAVSAAVLVAAAAVVGVLLDVPAVADPPGDTLAVAEAEGEAALRVGVGSSESPPLHAALAMASTPAAITTGKRCRRNKL